MNRKPLVDVSMVQTNEIGYNYSCKPHINSHRDTRMSGGLGNCVGGATTMTNHTTRKSSEVKTCSKCKESKPFSEFHADRSMRDGLRNHCKACRVEERRAYYAANREREAEGKAEYNRAYRAANRERIAEYYARNRAKYPDRYAARQEVYKAVKRGDFPPASALVCDHCQEAQAEQWHHHLGYAPEHRLDVIAVCRVCHVELDKEN